MHFLFKNISIKSKPVDLSLCRRKMQKKNVQDKSVLSYFLDRKVFSKYEYESMIIL